MTPEDQIWAGLEQLDLPGQASLVESLCEYLALLVRWNRVTNLTSVDDPVRMVPLHLMDSLSIAPYVRGSRIIDIGSGAGLPGIPLALLFRDKEFILLDSNGKKTRFMTQATITLGLSNVKVVQSRVQDCDGEFDHVLSRAFSSLKEFVNLCSRLLAPGGSLLAMKGPAELQDAGDCSILHMLDVPGLEAQRYLVEIRQ